MHDYVVLALVLYLLFGSDLTYNCFGGGAFGERISQSSKNPVFRWYFRIHARIDPNMRTDESVLGYKGKLP